MLQRSILRIFQNRKTLNILIYFILLVYLFYPSIDPDLGWHIKYGEFFAVNHKLLINNIFSWTLSGYEWFSISWIYDFLLYLLFPKISFFGLSFLAVLICIATYYFTFKKYPLPYHLLLPFSFLFIYFLSPVASVGFRVQLFELLYIAILNYCFLAVGKVEIKQVIFLPLIMIAWSNTHGSFIVGFLIVGFFVFCGVFHTVIDLINSQRAASDKIKKISGFLIIGVLSFISTLLNPYGGKIYLQVIDYFPSKLAKGVNEWFPVLFPSELWFFLFVWTLVLMYVVYQKRRTTQGLFEAMISLTFSYLAFKSRRMVAPFIVATFPIVLAYVCTNPKLLKFRPMSLLNILVFFMVLTMLANVLFVRLPGLKFGFISTEDYCQMGARCSVAAANYLKENVSSEKIFTPYDVGGFLIWKNPKSKVFIDGRMDQWKKNGVSPFYDHQKITFENDTIFFDKYGFLAAYVFPESSLDGYLRTKVNEWKMVFEDKNAVIYQKIKND